MFNYFGAATLSVNDTLVGLVSWLDHHAVNLIIIFAGAWLVRRFGNKLVQGILARTVRADMYPTKTDRDKRIKTLTSLSSAVLRTGVYIVVAILVLGEINPSYATALFASAGLVTVAIGFGAKNLIQDFISGMFIISENQYRVGDVVMIADVSGTVEAVTIRTTILRDIEGNVHHVPNGAIVVTTNKTIGFSSLNEEIVLPQGTDLERVAHIIDHIGEEMQASADFSKKIKEPPHFASYNGFGQGGLVIKVAGKTAPGDKYTVRSEFYARLYKAFRKHNIEPVTLPMPIANVAKKK